MTVIASPSWSPDTSVEVTRKVTTSPAFTVVVGVPYPNLGDPKLQLKLESLKQRPAANNSSNAGGGHQQPQPQEDWSRRYYEALCMRSVNQSIGRCIRHAGDYATVVLMDERYADSRVVQQLPRWMQPRVASNLRFGDVMKATRDFFQGFP